MLVAPHKFAPALSGVPPDPAPPLCLDTAIAMLCELAKLAALLRCTFGAARHGMTPAPRHPFGRPAGLRAASAGAVLDWRRGVGRLRRTVTRPVWGRGALGGVSNTRPIVLASCGLLNTRHDTRLGALPPTKRGRRRRAQEVAKATALY